MKKLIGLVFVLVSVTACATFEVEGPGSIKPNSVTGSQTVHGSLYGFRWQSYSIEKCEEGNLFRVEHHTNALMLLASVATLGLYVPQTVEWWCDTPVSNEVEEEWIPGE